MDLAGGQTPRPAGIPIPANPSQERFWNGNAIWPTPGPPDCGGG